MAFDHKPLYIEKYNNIIETAQKSILTLEISEFKQDISALENDVKVYLEILKYHVKDLDTTKTEIYNYQCDFLKKSFESANIKVLKMVRTP